MHPHHDQSVSQLHPDPVSTIVMLQKRMAVQNRQEQRGTITKTDQPCKPLTAKFIAASLIAVVYLLKKEASAEL